jgi:hypothetical protein
MEQQRVTGDLGHTTGHGATSAEQGDDQMNDPHSESTGGPPPRVELAADAERPPWLTPPPEGNAMTRDVASLLAAVDRAQSRAVALDFLAGSLEEHFIGTDGEPHMLVQSSRRAAFAARPQDISELALDLREAAARERVIATRLAAYQVPVGPEDIEQYRPPRPPPPLRVPGEGAVANPKCRPSLM